MKYNNCDKVLIWSTAIKNLFERGRNVGGIAVQLYYWAQIFSRKGWEVNALTIGKTFVRDDVVFEKWCNWGKLEILHEWIGIFWILLKLRPQLVISRGADRVAFPLAVLSKLFGTKYIFFGASDVNFEPGKELMAGGKHNRTLWQKAVPKIDCFVVQNQHQQKTLKENYQKESLVLFNLWGDTPLLNGSFSPTDVVWVANLRKLKRPEWVLIAAEALPDVDFTMIGGPVDDKVYYDEIKQQAEKIPNLHFLGPKQFDEVNAIVAQATILCCTSTFEGFPNTFLQAWANDLPVISSVDPSNVISDNGLGVVVKTSEDFVNAINALHTDIKKYNLMQNNVHQYFNVNHSSEQQYQKLINWLSL